MQFRDARIARPRSRKIRRSQHYGIDFTTDQKGTQDRARRGINFGGKTKDILGGVRGWLVGLDVRAMGRRISYNSQLEFMT